MTIQAGDLISIRHLAGGIYQVWPTGCTGPEHLQHVTVTPRGRILTSTCPLARTTAREIARQIRVTRRGSK